MNGAVYISFFQGQLESVLEQVVQLAVQEISRTVGSSLNALLLETAARDQENQRLRLQLRDSRDIRDIRGPAAEGGGTKPEQPQPHPQPQRGQHAPGWSHAEPRRLEQRGRVVDQLKSVMEQVLDFAVRELTKIVEASFDDLLLEITKMEREQQVLEERLGKSSKRGGGGEGGGDKSRGGGGGGGDGGRRRGSENHSVSPSGSEEVREEQAAVPVSKERAEPEDPQRPPVLSLSQDWVPVLDKVFGQKWCSDVWQVKELTAGGVGGGRSQGEEGPQQAKAPRAPSSTSDPAPSSPQQDPRWTPLEEMEVLSPDDDAAKGQRNTTTARPSTRPPLTPPAEGATSPAARLTGSSGRCSSASMLHRLLTLPSQLLEEDEEDAAAKETLVTLANDGTDCQDGTEAPGLLPLTTREEEEEAGEEDEEEDKGRKKKRRRVWSECDECGRRFSRMSLLKAHRQTHVAETTTADTSSPSSPPGTTSSPLRCSECGKRFSSATRLHSHILTQHPGNHA